MAVLRPIKVVADWLQRPPRTVRSWYEQDLFDVTACDLKTRAILVEMTEARRLDQQHARRSRHAERR